jgi:hypothetical protein
MFTLFHLGQLVGTTEFEHPGSTPNQRLGKFQPTDYGLTVLPRLTGLLEAAFGLKREMERLGIDPEGDADVISAALEEIPDGRRVVDVGRAISEMELRNDNGQVVVFTSLAISDVRQLIALAGEVTGSHEDPDDVGDWRYLISATFTPPREPDAATAAGWLHRPGTRN